MTRKMKRSTPVAKKSSLPRDVCSGAADVGAYVAAETVATGLELGAYAAIALADDTIDALPADASDVEDKIVGAGFQTGGSFGGDSPVTGGSISDGAVESSMFDSLSGLGDQIGDLAGSAFEGLSSVAGSAADGMGSLAEGAADVAGEVIGGIFSAL